MRIGQTGQAGANDERGDGKSGRSALQKVEK